MQNDLSWSAGIDGLARTTPRSMRLPDGWRSPIVAAAVALGLTFLGWTFLVEAPRLSTMGLDAFAYWGVDPSDPYRLPVGAVGAFNYSPPMVLVAQLARILPWPVFLWTWTGLLAATAVWLGGRRALLVLAFPPVVMELYYGNVNLLIAAAVVVGFRYPAAWSFVLLTKPSCGVGLLWFAARREWRALATALLVTGLIAGCSMLLVPDLWTEWWSFLLGSATRQPPGAWLPVPLWMRLPVAAAIVIWGARTDRRWTVAVAVAVALPVVWFAGLAVLAALVRDDRSSVGAGLAGGGVPGPDDPVHGWSSERLHDLPAVTGGTS